MFVFFVRVWVSKMYVVFGSGGCPNGMEVGFAMISALAGYHEGAEQALSRQFMHKRKSHLHSVWQVKDGNDLQVQRITSEAGVAP